MINPLNVYLSVYFHLEPLRKPGKNASEHAAVSVDVGGLGADQQELEASQEELGADQQELDSLCRELLQLWTEYLHVKFNCVNNWNRSVVINV